MKTILFFLSILTVQLSYSQDWSLFPLDQESFYYGSLYPNYQNVESYVMDSIRESGTDSVLYFRKKGAGVCYETIVQNYGWFLPNNFLQMDSLVLHEDTVFYYSDLSTTPFYFLPRANVGQSWTIVSTYGQNDYDQITITCSGIQQQTFFGLTDSVKTFTMTANGTSSGQTPVSNFEMRLSKTYGLIEFVPFVLFLYHPYNVNFTTLELIGLDSSGNKHGYEQPLFHDYFHLSPGDIRHWEFSYDPAGWQFPIWREYFRDSITQVDTYLDSVIYTFDRAVLDTNNIVTVYNDLVERHIYDQIGHIVEAPTKWIGIGGFQFDQTFLIWTQGLLVWESTELKLKVDSNSADTITEYSFYTEDTGVDTVNCQLNFASDVGLNFTVDTRVGISRYCYYNFREICYTLIGSRINGHQLGDITLSIDKRNSMAHFSIKVYPNPASDYIRIQGNGSAGDSSYELFDGVGRSIETGKMMDNRIAIGDLPDGFYYIKITTVKGTSTGKFVKG